jgi:HNH endonuclease
VKNAKTDKERFCEKFEAVTESGCWIWTGALERKYGYGFFQFQGKLRNAHRVSWQLFRGEIPKGMFVLHRCDVSACVNPYHLFLGTQADNMADKVAKGRQAKGMTHGSVTVPDALPRGTDHWKNKLTESDVRAIRASTLTQTELSHQYDVSVQQIHRIVHRQSWTHLER